MMRTDQEIKAENSLLILGNILHALGILFVAAWGFYIAYSHWPENLEKLFLMAGIALVAVGYLVSGLSAKLKLAREIREKYDGY